MCDRTVLLSLQSSVPSCLCSESFNPVLIFVNVHVYYFRPIFNLYFKKYIFFKILVLNYCQQYKSLTILFKIVAMFLVSYHLL